MKGFLCIRGIEMVIKKLHHTVTRPGRMIVDEDDEIKGMSFGIAR